MRLSLPSAALLCACLTSPCLAQTPDAFPCPPEQPAAPPPAFGGPFCERPKLTGDWCGLRNDLAAYGIAFDGSLTQFYQGVPTGGGRARERDWQYGGKGDYFFNVDGEKAGLWKGLFITAHGETRYGEDVNRLAGTLSPSNVNMLFPKPNQTVTALTALKFTQALSENFVTFFGKLNALDDYQPALGGGGRGIDRFTNASLVFPLILGRTLPYSTYGAGFAVLRDKEVVASFAVLDAVDRATTGVDDAFDRGVVYVGQATLPVKLGGLPGHHSIGGNYSTRKYTALDGSSFFFTPDLGIRAGRETGSWCLYYSFDQFLHVDECDPKRGWGVFGNVGISDGNPNPIGWFASGGVQGNSIIPSRERDTFGAGFFYVGLSSDVKNLLGAPLPRRLGLSQRDEYGAEVFYNVAVTPWCHVTADVQVVEPSTRAFSTTLIAGVRVKIDF